MKKSSGESSSGYTTGSSNNLLNLTVRGLKARIFKARELERLMGSSQQEIDAQTESYLKRLETDLLWIGAGPQLIRGLLKELRE